ncbi:MAG TPA: MarR family transcriptional regulator [Galbitalea sp.]|jgi:DNA-binding MarR family transcriptional regulator
MQTARTEADATASDRAEVARALEAVLTWLRQARQTSPLSLSTLSALARLETDGPLRVTQLAAREGLTQPGMTTLLNRLEDAGLAIREPDPDDGRALRISITQAGREAITAHRAVRQRLILERLDQMGTHDLAALVDALPALNHFIAVPVSQQTL